MVNSKVVPAVIAAVLAISSMGLVVQRASMPQLPVSLRVREAILGHGEVVRVQNFADFDLAVQARIVDAASHRVRNLTWNIDRGRSAEFGHLEGYTFEPGDQITLAHDRFKARTWILP
jgi:hypothetical protein